MHFAKYIFGGLGIFGLPNFINTTTSDSSGIVTALIGIAIAMTAGFLLTFFFWKPEAVEKTDNKPEGSKQVKKALETIQTENAGV